MTIVFVVVAWCVASFLARAIAGDAPSLDAAAEAIDSRNATDEHLFFEQHVRPILIAHCYECHAAETEQRGGLLLDRATGWRDGGDSGPAIVPGDPSASLLWRAIRYDDPHLQMPPAGPLAAREVEAIRQWIASGAHDPRRDERVVPRGATASRDATAGRSHWAYQPIRAVRRPHPELTDAGTVVNERRLLRSSIDAWLDLAQQAKGVLPSERAARRTLIRRLTFDLHGLAPTMSEVQAFVTDQRVDAYERLVDRLLASPRYAEHMARHWLDVARYAESLTLRGFVLPNAWRYRDYCIEAFASDLPYDEFVREQLAGDLMESSDVATRRRRVIAASFLLLGNTNLEEQDKRQLEMDVVDEQLDTLGRALLGQTLGCARCHDHKFDPIATRDYYALAGILRADDVLIHDNVSQWIEVPLPVDALAEAQFAQQEQRLSDIGSQIESLEQLAKAPRGEAKPATGDGANPDALVNATESTQAKLEALRHEKDELTAQLQRRPRALGRRRSAEPRDLPIHIRGSVHHLGETVPRGFVPCMSEGMTSAADAVPDRLALAEWITDARHPLTARVAVNRVWCWLMGAGLVRSVDNLGTTGESPTQPELLDWLASDFVRHEWSIKHVVRTIVLSEAYCRSSRSTPAGESSDPENGCWWRAERKPIPAEALRDAMLQISGELTLAVGSNRMPPSLQADYHYVHREPCRTIYVPAFRNAIPEIVEAFNGANPSVSQGERARSILPQQALWMLNDEWIDERSRTVARRWLRDHGDRDDDSVWIERATEAILGRPPLAGERLALGDYLKQARRARSGLDEETLATMVHSLFASIEFRMVD